MVSTQDDGWLSSALRSESLVSSTISDRECERFLSDRLETMLPFRLEFHVHDRLPAHSSGYGVLTFATRLGTVMVFQRRYLEYPFIYQTRGRGSPRLQPWGGTAAILLLFQAESPVIPP